MPLKVLEPRGADPLFQTTTADVSPGRGFYPEEGDGAGRFRWMAPSGVLHFAPAATPRWLEFHVLSEFNDLSQRMRIAAGSLTEDLPLAAGWAPLSVAVPPQVESVTLTVNKPFPPACYPGDARTLAVRIRDIRLHADPERHAALQRQYDNVCLNQQEALEGRIVLASTPPRLGIDLHGACNVKPPCVYCEWDLNKALEGPHADVPFTSETLRDWGAFFDNATDLVNCSIGEPFMMRNLDELLDIFGRTGKALQMTTNGQILTERNVQRLLGLPIDLYVSLDAATPGTYAKLRNNTFEKILVNLRRLVAAKGGRGRLPSLHLVFMPMRCNAHELDAFVRLAADLGVDRLVLRPLNYSDTSLLDWDRAGYHFRYQDELLPFAELVRLSGRAARLAERLGVPLSDQMDFGGVMRTGFQEAFDRGWHEADHIEATAAAERGAVAGRTDAASAADRTASPAETADGSTTPAGVTRTSAAATALADGAAGSAAEPARPSLGEGPRTACLEPWKSLYILRRGILPCCHGDEAIAPMEDYAQAWNSPVMQGIRRELLQGRFHHYCLRSVACPIVRKHEQAGALGVRRGLAMRARHALGRLDRLSGGRLARWVYTPVNWTAPRLARALTDPRYLARHTMRLVGRLGARAAEPDARRASAASSSADPTIRRPPSD